MRVCRDINGVRALGCIQNSDGSFLSEEVAAKFSGDLVIGPPNSDLEGVGARAWQNVVDGIVVQPVEVCPAFSGVKVDGDDERSVDAAGDLENRLIDL